MKGALFGFYFILHPSSFRLPKTPSLTVGLLSRTREASARGSVVVLLPEVFEADAQVVEGGGRDGGDEHPGHQAVRDSDGQEVRRALVDVSPEQAAREGRGGQPRVRHVEHREGQGNEEDAYPTLPPDHLRPPVDEALQRVLLQRPPAQAERGHAEDGRPALPAQEV